MGDIPSTTQPAGDISSGSKVTETEGKLHSIPGSSAEQDAMRASYKVSQDPYGYMQPALSPTSHRMMPQGRVDSFNMAPLGTALPNVGYQNYNNIPIQRYHSGQMPHTMIYQNPNVSQYTTPNVLNPNSASPPYNVQYAQQQYAPSSNQMQQGAQAAMQSSSHLFQGQDFVPQTQHMGAPYYSQQAQYGAPVLAYSGIRNPVQYGYRGSATPDSRSQSQARGSDFSVAASVGSPGLSSSMGSSSGPSSVVRGPPRKPRQSGHAIWIGNLPPQTELMSLVHHVCKEAPGLQSLFLISKSNCAFANFKDEASCSSAQAKIHDSRFQTVRLVSRLRRGSVGNISGSSIPTGPAALTPPTNPPIARSPSPDSPVAKKGPSVSTGDAGSAEDANLPKDKFFIVKSLTVEDLELSVRNGIWATQSHNEEALNKAYQAADNVYLIFSANKSGEYFGYAKMTSEINDDPAAAIQFAPSAHTVEDPDLPKAIPTTATEHAPKGRIIDDSARGTIFWEAEPDEGEEDLVDGIADGASGDDESPHRSEQGQDSETNPSKAWGKPFKLEWISTTHLPFYRTRGLRNPWNSNREVKIARDGTELEPSVGRRLTGLFHRTNSPIAPSMQSLPVAGMMGGYPAMRPY